MLLESLLDLRIGHLERCHDRYIGLGRLYLGLINVDQLPHEHVGLLLVQVVMRQNLLGPLLQQIIGIRQSGPSYLVIVGAGLFLQSLNRRVCTYMYAMRRESGSLLVDKSINSKSNTMRGEHEIHLLSMASTRL